MTCHRKLWLLDRGSASHRAATTLLEGHDVLRVSPEPRSEDEVTGAMTRKLLGCSYDAVVLDIGEGLDPDVLGRVQGMVRAGGALVLVAPGFDDPGHPRSEVVADGFEVPPMSRFRSRFRAEVASYATQPEPIVPRAPVTGSAEQRRMVGELERLGRAPGVFGYALLANRGRGKSAALGLALCEAGASGLRVVVTAAARSTTWEVERFAGRWFRYLEIDDIDPTEWDIVFVDEAAAISVPVLKSLVLSGEDTSFVFASTVHGYEGTGRGFALRFLPWLEERRPTVLRTLREPIRWSSDDPLEEAMFRALLLDASPAEAPRSGSEITFVEIDRDQLVRDEGLLRQVFGLLVQAHYRTTPSDLERLLDAPNMRVHAALAEGVVVGVNLVAIEGDLGPAVIEQSYRGARRLRGHALPESLVSHLGVRAAGELRYLRSVRIATHPELRRRGVAARLVDHVHDSYEPDFFGTLFGATPELLKFRHGLGYRTVRLAASRGDRAGEPSVALLRPRSVAAVALMAELRERFARDLPLQMEYLAADGPRPSEGLVEGLRYDLPGAEPLRAEAIAAEVEDYARGPRTHESRAWAIEHFVREHVDLLSNLSERHRSLLELRVLKRLGWRDTAAGLGVSVPAAMRAMRRAVAEFYEAEKAYRKTS